MKNPFIKENNSTLIAVAITSAIAAGALAWYYLKRNAKPPQIEEHAKDYLKPKPKLHKRTTDLHDLHAIVG